MDADPYAEVAEHSEEEHGGGAEEREPDGERPRRPREQQRARGVLSARRQRLGQIVRAKHAALVQQ